MNKKLIIIGSSLTAIAIAGIVFYGVNKGQDVSTLGGITIMNATDTLKDSRSVINNNFTYLENNKLDNADMTGDEGITYTATGTISFDCSEVEGTGIDCSGEDITLDATGDWTGTLDGVEGSAYALDTDFASYLTQAYASTTFPTYTYGSSTYATSTHTHAGYQPTDSDLTTIGGLTGNKGDIITYSSSWTDLAVGTNGQLLMASSTTATGLAWTSTSSLGISGGSGTPGGSDTQVQFNDSSSFGGDSGLVYNKTSDVLTLVHASTTDLTASGNIWATSFYGDGSNLTNIGATAASALTISAKAGEALKKGQAVYINGASSTAAMPTVMKASPLASSTSRIIGLVAADAAQNATVLIRRAGTLTTVDTLGTTDANPGNETWTAGDLLFATTSGGLTNIRPTSGRSVKVAYTLKGSDNTDTLLAYPMENPVWITAAANEDVVLRVGDTAGTNKVSIRNYTNTEKASINSLGYLTAVNASTTVLSATTLYGSLIGNVTGTASGNLTSGSIDTLAELNAILTGEEAASTSQITWTMQDGDSTTYPVTSADTLQIAEGTGIDSDFTGDDVLTISHLTTNGYVHIPADGSSAQLLQYTSAGTAKWITMSGDITIADGGATSIGDNKVVEADLKAVDSASDEECLTYETTTGDFEWQECGTGSSATTTWQFATSTATAAQTVFNTGFTYSVGENQLEVYVNGLRMTQNDDYYETSSTAITFTSGRQAGDKVSMQVSGGATAGEGSGTVTSVAMSVPTGLEVSGSPITDSGTLAVTLASGYIIPLSASTTNWNTFYDTPSNRITAGDGIDWSTNTLNVDNVTAPMLASADFGDFTCNGTTCSLDATYLTASSSQLTLSGNLWVTGKGTFGTASATDLTVSSDLWTNTLTATGQTVLGSASTTQITASGNIWAGGFIGNLTGNANTATALASNPTDCSAGQYATTIAASGNLTCSAITYAGITAMTSANFAGLISDETGTAGTVVLSVSPTFTGTVTMANASSTVLTVTTGYLGTLLGTIDAGGATAFEIPNGTAPVFSATGQLGWDTSDNQLLVATSTADTPLVIPTMQKLWGGTIASTSVDFLSGGRIWLPLQRDGFKIREIHCAVDGGTSVVINVSNSGGTTDSETVTCDADGATDTSIDTNPTYAAGSLNSLEIGTVTGTVDYLTFSVWGIITRE